MATPGITHPEAAHSDATTNLWVEPPGMAKSVAITSVLAAIVFFVCTTAGMRINGQSWATAAGLGLFVAFWGGLGFGGMSGGVRHALHLEARDAEANHAKHLVTATPARAASDSDATAASERSESDQAMVP